MLPALGQVCSLSSPFERDLEDYASGKCRAVELWLTKLESFVTSRSVEEVIELLRRYELDAPVASLQGGLLMSQGPERQAAWELLASRLSLCQQTGIQVMVVACDCPAPLSARDIDRVRLSLNQLAQQAGDQGVQIALEFQAKSAFGNNLQTAAALVEESGSPHLGICLDAFHFFVGPSMTEDLALLNADNLFHVQLCDLADIPREFATDSDRILPGDGDIPLAAIIARLREIDYRRYVSLEVMNPQLWQISPLQFGEIAMTALRAVLGQASMGNSTN